MIGRSRDRGQHNRPSADAVERYTRGAQRGAGGDDVIDNEYAQRMSHGSSVERRAVKSVCAAAASLCRPMLAVQHPLARLAPPMRKGTGDKL